MPAENDSAASGIGSHHRDDALHLGPRKKACISDPLIGHGRHFCRTVHALCNIKTLLTNGILRIGEQADEPDEVFTAEQRREHRVFTVLLQMVPNLEARLMEGVDDDVVIAADLIQKGVSSARSDDTKSLKGSILDWIVPLGHSLNPPLARNIKTDRGFHHERTGALLCPAGLDWSDPEIKGRLRSGEMTVPGDQWPIFLYAGYEYDPQNPWKGLFKSTLLVCAYKHIFTSPSSVEKCPKATRSASPRLQSHMLLPSSASVFSRSDTVTDSERFYHSVVEYFEDVDEQEEVKELLVWWNRHIFPTYSSAQRAPTKNSVLAKIKEQRALRISAQRSNPERCTD
ncbi:hypothetical protein PILCRDRAFT_4229 [Piloderma croceum F 1598]|uniref:Uncharacterized protein n=1 Tax=Piloderma croceum (strain F 1598) TaxID=765440 RepID=A0A0C3G585_PILCF|nr:hypothetical protein PILCRDRAFT_4229 [Piloderma croceum F 1598]